jgi:hypothetical protein
MKKNVVAPRPVPPIVPAVATVRLARSTAPRKGSSVVYDMDAGDPSRSSGIHSLSVRRRVRR